MGAVFLIVVFWFLLGGGVGYLIGREKGRETAGFWWGLLLGWIGWIVAALLTPTVEHEARRQAQVQRLVHGPAPTRSASKPPLDGLRFGNARTTEFASQLAHLEDEATRDGDSNRLLASLTSLGDAITSTNRRPSAWCFNDGAWPVVARLDGVTHLARVGALRRLSGRPSVVHDVEVGTGRVVAISIDGIDMPRPRPAAEARILVAQLGSRIRDHVEPAAPVLLPEATGTESSALAPAAPGVQQTGADRRRRLEELGDLREAGLISDEEYHVKRTSIVEEI